MEEFIKKTANIEEMGEVLIKLENKYAEFKDVFSKLKEFFYKNTAEKIFYEISNKLFFMDLEIKDLIRKIKETKRFESKKNK